MTVGVIVAGGLATRMGQLTQNKPKVLLPIAGRPLLSHQISLYKNFDINEIIILAKHQSAIIQEYLILNYFDEYSTGKIQMLVENNYSGSGGCLASLRNVKDSILVIFGDIAINMDLSRFVVFHKEHGGVASIVTQINDHLHESDIVAIDEKNKCIKVHCKPHEVQELANNNSMVAGVFILEPDIFAKIKTDIPLDLVRNIIAKEVDNKKPIFAYLTNEYLDDIGTPERYKRINKEWSPL